MLRFIRRAVVLMRIKKNCVESVEAATPRWLVSLLQKELLCGLQAFVRPYNGRRGQGRRILCDCEDIWQRVWHALLADMKHSDV